MKFFNTDVIPTILGELVPRYVTPKPNPIVTLKPYLTLDKDTGFMAYAPPVPKGAESESHAPTIDETVWKNSADVPPTETGWYVCGTVKKLLTERYWNGVHWSFDFHERAGWTREGRQRRPSTYPNDQLYWLRKVIL